MVLAFFSEDFQKASRDKTEINDLQMKHTMVSFEVQKKKKAKKEINQEKWSKNGLKIRNKYKRKENKYKNSKIIILNKPS